MGIEQKKYKNIIKNFSFSFYQKIISIVYVNLYKKGHKMNSTLNNSKVQTKALNKLFEFKNLDLYYNNL